MNTFIEYKINYSVERLKERINEFADLADIDEYYNIENNPIITKRLQEAYNILYDRVFISRCIPCEYEALCTIKEILNKPKPTSMFNPNMFNIDINKLKEYYEN